MNCCDPVTLLFGDMASDSVACVGWVIYVTGKTGDTPSYCGTVYSYKGWLDVESVGYSAWSVDEV